MYIKLIEQADKELENDIFAAIEQQRQEFETEFSDGGKSRSKSFFLSLESNLCENYDIKSNFRYVGFFINNLNTVKISFTNVEPRT